MGKDRELPPPLEMMCLNALWSLEEGNVEEVRRIVSSDKPLAYTTVLTLLDRLSRRGAVSRRKEGRGFRYQPVVDRNKLRRLALDQFLTCHFDNSISQLRSFLEVSQSAVSQSAVSQTQPAQTGPVDSPQVDRSDRPAFEAGRAMATYAGATGSPLLPRE